MESDKEIDFRKLVGEQNRKKKKSGGFQSMGLCQTVFKGIMKKGYKIPTPIQRKCIPIILNGQDVVAMARTGSGKTAAFLIPMFERLQVRSAKTGARALILTPTRELALQTFQFIKELGRFTGLKTILILGGEKIDNSFAAMHENPDVIVAVPGRFRHVIIEMSAKLSSIEYVVCDEADRLFGEQKLAEDIYDIMNQLPENRQTVLFSATLPKTMADFSKAKLNDPTLLRLDTDSKLSDQLKMAFITCRSEDKIAILLYLLRNVIQHEQLTVIFVPTNYHAEYLATILNEANINCTYLYSKLDQTARKINVTKFQSKNVGVLIATDLAARGIDIPLLDNVINFNFPARPKEFVHRVGRVARAGRSGIAYSLLSSEEIALCYDLHLFLGNPINFVEAGSEIKSWDSYIGTASENIINDVEDELRMMHSTNIELVNLKEVCKNAYKKHLQLRQKPSKESVRRMKIELQIKPIGIHPLFSCKTEEGNSTNILEQMKSYKPRSTIFEINSTAKTQAAALMKKFRERNKKIVSDVKKAREERINLASSCKQQVDSNIQNFDDQFSHVVTAPPNRGLKPKRKRTTAKNDSEFYVPYKPNDHYTERGLEVKKNSFLTDTSNAVFDLMEDDVNSLRNRKKQQKWDRKKKRFMDVTGKESKCKKIKTESGVWIPASYKLDLYKKWLNSSKMESREENDESDEEKTGEKNQPRRQKHAKWGMKAKHKTNDRGGNELKSKEEIMKKRQIKLKQRRRQEKRYKKGRPGKR